MEGVKLYGGSSSTVLLQNERLHCPSEIVDPLWLHNSEPSSQSSRSMVNFENASGSRVIMDRPFFQPVVEKEEKVVVDDDDDDYDGCFHQGKKRRLTSEQVQFLERSFEVENKLDPERKVQLAKELGMQPRQVAIWFQNRRARSKTKKIEKDSAELKASYDKLQVDYNNILQENQKLKEEVNTLKNRLIAKEKEEEDLGDKLCFDVNSKHAEPMDLFSIAASRNESKAPLPLMVNCKQEDANSAKSDVLDSDSTNYTEGNHSSFGEPDHSDFSQDEADNNLNHGLLTTMPILPKVEDAACYHGPNDNNSCNFGFPTEDQPFCYWPY